MQSREHGLGQNGNLEKVADENHGNKPFERHIGRPAVRVPVEGTGCLCRLRALRMLTEGLTAQSALEKGSCGDWRSMPALAAAIRLEDAAFRFLCLTVSSASTVSAEHPHNADSMVATNMNRYLASITRLSFGLKSNEATNLLEFVLRASEDAFVAKSSRLNEVLLSKNDEEFKMSASSCY